MGGHRVGWEGVRKSACNGHKSLAKCFWRLQAAATNQSIFPPSFLAAQVFRVCVNRRSSFLTPPHTNNFYPPIPIKQGLWVSGSDKDNCDESSDSFFPQDFPWKEKQIVRPAQEVTQSVQQ